MITDSFIFMQLIFINITEFLLSGNCMNLEIIREHAMEKPGTTEELPFDEDSPVYKVLGKMYMIVNLIPPYSISLKCAPERAIELREQYEGIKPGWHLNKKHWNTIILQEDVPDELFIELIDHSYELVVQKLRKSDQELLKNM